MAAGRHLHARSFAPLRGGVPLRLAGEAPTLASPRGGGNLSLRGAWLDQADLVGEDHGLDAVA